MRPDDLGILQEHLVLEHLQAHFPDTPARYWRNKQGREMDFVLFQRRDEVEAIECRWNSAAFDSSALEVFRGYYPKGRNFLITPSGSPVYTRRVGNLDVLICTPELLIHPQP